MNTKTRWMTAAFAVAAMTWSAPTLQAADPAPTAAEKEAREAEKAAKQAEKQARAEEKREKATLNNMPQPARDAITAEVKEATEIDYYKLAEGGDKVFGATFKDKAGETIDVRYDRDGKLISRLSSADAATAAVPIPAAPGAPAPMPAPAAPAAPAPAAPIAMGQNVALEQIPAQPQAVLRQQVAGAHDIRFYRSMFGAQPVWEAKFATADGKDMAVRVDDAGKVVNSRVLDFEESRKEVKFDSLPDEVRASMRKETKGGEGAQFYQNTFNNMPVFETKFWKDDTRMLVRMDATGKVVDTKELKDDRKASVNEDKDKDKK